MAKRRFRPEDGLRLTTATDPDLSPDRRRVAFVVTRTDVERDRPDASIWAAPADGSAPARPFSEGPADKSPRWSPDGRWLAYISIADDEPAHAHVQLAPLDGGVPARLGDLPGPVSQLAWSPDSRRIVVVCRVGVPDRAKASASERNGPRVVRGIAARLDGVGWQDGRRHLFLVDVEGGSATQLTRGDYDHARPLVLAGRRGDRVRLRPPPTPERPPVPKRCVGRVHRRRPAPSPHEREGPRRLPGVLPDGKPSPSPVAKAAAWIPTSTCSSCPQMAVRRRSWSRRTSIDRCSCSPAFRRRSRWIGDRELIDARRRPWRGRPAPGAAGGAAEPRDRQWRHHHRRGRCPRRPARGRVHGLWPDRPSELFATTTRGGDRSS